VGVLICSGRPDVVPLLPGRIPEAADPESVNFGNAGSLGMLPLGHFRIEQRDPLTSRLSRSLSAATMAVALAAAITGHSTARADNGGDALTESETRFRSAFGLTRDQSEIERVKKDYREHKNGAVRWDGGIYLSAAEDAELKERDRAGAEDAPALKKAVNPSAFGGMYIDNTTETGSLTVWLTEVNGKDAAAARKAVKRADRLLIKKTQYSLDEKVAVARAITDARADFETVGHELVSSGLDQFSDRIRVAIQDATPDQAAYVASRWGSYPVVVESSGPSEMMGTRSPTAPPARSGGLLNVNGSGPNTNVSSIRECTSGFSAYKDTSGGRQFFLLTAGHCAVQQNNNFMAGQFVGTTNLSAWPFNHTGTIGADAASMPTTSAMATSQIYNCNSSVREIARFIQPSGDVAGVRVNISGTARIAANQPASACYDVAYGRGSGAPGGDRCYSGVCVRNARTVSDLNNPIDEGDSGAPVYSRGTDDAIVGVGQAISKDTFSNYTFSYSAVDAIKSVLGLTGYCATPTNC
jgi:hypothetical protein